MPHHCRSTACVLHSPSVCLMTAHCSAISNAQLLWRKETPGAAKTVRQPYRQCAQHASYDVCSCGSNKQHCHA